MVLIESKGKLQVIEGRLYVRAYIPVNSIKKTMGMYETDMDLDEDNILFTIPNQDK